MKRDFRYSVGNWKTLSLGFAFLKPYVDIGTVYTKAVTPACAQNVTL